MFGLLAIAFSFSSTVEAANPIKPSQSRVTHTLKDMNGVSYKVYFAGVREKKGYGSYDHWPYAWAGVNEGDLVYEGNYTLYTHKVGTSHIKKSRFYFQDYTLNATRKMVHVYPSSVKGQPDILAVAETGSSNVEEAQWYYMKNGELTKIIDAAYTQRAKRISKNEFQVASYDNSDGTWYFHDLVFNPKNNTWEDYDVAPKNPSQVIKNWPKHWQ